MVAFILRWWSALRFRGTLLLKWDPPQIYLWRVPDLAPKNGLMYRRYTRGGCVGGSGKIQGSSFTEPNESIPVVARHVERHQVYS